MADHGEKLRQAAVLIENSGRVTAFTGAGVSVESGIPPFRGEGGLWNTINPEFLDIQYFESHPRKSWKLIKEIFYDFFGKARPNPAHMALGRLEQLGMLQSVITQNIDGLHQQGGNTEVCEFHGKLRDLVCTNCGKMHKAADVGLNELPPRCVACGAVLKPDFVFFGEPIPEPAQSNAHAEAVLSDLFLIIGTTGTIMPASLIPFEAANNGKTIVEINVMESKYTHSIADVFLHGKAGEVMQKLVATIEGGKGGSNEH